MVPVIPRRPQKVVDVVVAVAGVIFVGHGHGNVYDDVYDHHSPIRLSASLRRGKAPTAIPMTSWLPGFLRGLTWSHGGCPWPIQAASLTHGQA